MVKEVNLDDIQKELREGFGKVGEKFGMVDEKLGKIDTTTGSIHSDLVKHDKKFEGLTESLNKKPDSDEFPQLLDKIFEYTALKIKHDHMKKVIHEKLGVEI
ncbi:hypothetical protein A3H65_01150 [Candidatus Giovannonibacteria bacterium RIFCSPLOWO2_02_FULL_45_14]|uniref:Uncharacterized protein n=1 Tax=Candidatus Giovannonibacteria bacterium RIFCSPLOWO2_12_FULL_44_15 TaxID=1798364 RepID=A0A1F5XZW7_9BACT|nr:MAG: hypothetical protein A3C75_01330 [Candidatus Giovannonibacteria bacterium RIFCSPHIGHO2_02_FULL_44_31]OGF76372.1 MAG: hypothetical protein A3E62_00515 [Candidatus Giovannonibacteria bacterium RIFCSPHIGHO2_12_FULL_44_29]OGF90947.1 MAG: hypothetical protein A3H65_01150 [Candidatus Giovannonibacteria bacterium RIFCSPLOWO2_02_FULL_45_14]OGF93465.1 MAG: hypothetical protein A3G54_04215 [Candidatus Giovannonibacteria bacterium RIFCSPLOWO2_12_FULL_44_15]